MELLADRLSGGGRSRRADAPAPPQQLVVVLGVARSGTTWLQRLLLAHPQLGGPDGAETFLFHALGPLLTVLERRDPPDGSPTDLASVRAFCDELLGRGLRRHDPGSAWFVEKTPLHILQIPRIRRLYPDVWFVHVVRDGRDVARSWTEVDFFDHPPAGVAAAVWRDALERVRVGTAGHDRCVELRYESLVADPLREVSRLFEVFGLPASAANDAALADRVDERVSRHGTAGPVGPGKWHRLTARELAEVYVEAGPALVVEGYLDEQELSRWRRRPAYLAARVRRLLRKARTGTGRDDQPN